MQPVVWSVAAVALVWGGIGHFFIWIAHCPVEGSQLDRIVHEELAIKIGAFSDGDLAALAQAASAPSDGNTSSGITPEGTHWNDYWRHHHVDDPAEPELYDLRAPGQLTAVYLVYFLPLFLVGVCGWVTQNWPVSDAQVWEWNSRLRAAFSRQVPPVHFWKKYINGLSYSELSVILLFFVPKVSHLTWFLRMSRQQWLEGVNASYAIQYPTEAQYWLERIGLWLAVDFEVQAPFLFAFAARGSLVNSYLGVAFGTIIKWHRWIGVWTMANIFCHGTLYQVLLRSESASTWAVFYTRMHYLYGASSLAGRLSWICMIIMGACVIPLVRRKFYKVFYRVHVVGAALFVFFGIVHSRKVFVFFGPGLVLYGIDVAYRWLQASYDVTLHVNPGGKLVSIVIPLQEGVRYADGSHVWVAIPELGQLEYHPFCVASTSADPAWRSSILLYCKSFNRWTERLLEGAATGRLHKVTARVQGPFGGHDLPVTEMDHPQHMIVFVGGVGAPTVLSILKRLALHRDVHHRNSEEFPKVKVFHTARTLDEVILLAPLLDHPTVFDITLHYTGKTRLTTSTLIMPSPVLLEDEDPCGRFVCDEKTLMQMHVASNLKVYNGDASASIAASHTLSRMLPEHSFRLENTGRVNVRQTSITKRLQEIGGFKKVQPTFVPKPDPRLVAMRGKLEGLVVWVGAWIAAFFALMLGELWHNASAAHQAGLVDDQARNHRRYCMAAFNILALLLMVPLIPLSLLLVCRAVAAVRRKTPPATPSPPESPTLPSKLTPLATRKDHVPVMDGNIWEEPEAHSPVQSSSPGHTTGEAGGREASEGGEQACPSRASQLPLSPRAQSKRAGPSEVTRDIDAWASGMSHAGQTPSNGGDLQPVNSLYGWVLPNLKSLRNILPTNPPAAPHARTRSLDVTMHEGVQSPRGNSGTTAASRSRRILGASNSLTSYTQHTSRMEFRAQDDSESIGHASHSKSSISTYWGLPGGNFQSPHLSLRPSARRKSPSHPSPPLSPRGSTLSQCDATPMSTSAPSSHIADPPSTNAIKQHQNDVEIGAALTSAARLQISNPCFDEINLSPAGTKTYSPSARFKSNLFHFNSLQENSVTRSSAVQNEHATTMHGHGCDLSPPKRRQDSTREYIPNDHLLTSPSVARRASARPRTAPVATPLMHDVQALARSHAMGSGTEAPHQTSSAIGRRAGGQAQNRAGSMQLTDDSSFMHGAVADVDNVVVVDADSQKHPTIRTGKRSALPVPIKSGRPDVAAEINQCFAASQATGRPLSVWSAGPGNLNQAVHMAAHSLPLIADVRVFPMAYEL